MSTFTHLDLFAGIGGFSRAVHWLGGTTVGFVEWDSWNRRVLAKHWPEAQFYGDIRTVTNEHLRELGRIDLITGGYPCQPFSLAGQRRGHDDPRHLWPEMRRVIDATRPRFVLAENVAGHISMGLDAVLADLEADGYTCGAVVVPAGAVNALQRRDRVWIMAHASDDRSQAEPLTIGNRPPYAAVGNAGSYAPLSDRDGEHAPERGQRPAPAGEGAERRAHGSRGHADARQVADGNAGQDPRRMAHTPARGLRRGSASGQSGQPSLSGESVGDAAAPRRASGASEQGRALRDETRWPEPERRRSRGGGAGEGEAARTLDISPHGLSPGSLRRPATGPAWDDPDVIRAMWADGSWELDLPRVVTDEPERRQKLQAAGNAIVPIVAYEILRVMLGETA